MRVTKKTYGFTIPELLVAIAITVVLMTILFQVFAAAIGQWQAADQRIDTFRDARAAMQLIVRDLSRADLNGNAQMIRLSDPFSNFAKEAYAIAPIPNSGKSDLCTVGYYCAFDEATKTYSLKRVFKNSNVTFDSLATLSPDYDSIYQKNAPDPDEIVAAYVWDLQVRPGVGKDFVSVTTAPSTWDWLEVRFKSMSPAAARKIRGTAVDISTWFNPGSDLYKTLILPFEQQFVTRIVLRQNQ